MIHNKIYSDDPLLDIKMIQRNGRTNLSGWFIHILQSKNTNTTTQKKKNSSRKKASIGDLMVVVHSQGQADDAGGRADNVTVGHGDVIFITPSSEQGVWSQE